MNQKQFNEYCKAHHAAGAIAAVFNKHGEIINRYIYGIQDLSANHVINTDTRFGIASMTKSFTALSILQLVEKGCFGLQDSVCDVLDQCSLDKNIRIHHLLTHSAGFYPQKRILMEDVAQQLEIDLANDDGAYQNEIAQEGKERILGQLTHDCRRCGKPGEWFSYSNDSYGLLGELIRQYSDCHNYARHVEQYIFAPLNMVRTTCQFNLLAADSNTTALFRENGVSAKNYYDLAFAINSSGSIKSTVHDMIAYCTALMNKSEQLGISSKLLDKMFSPHIQAGYHQFYGYGLFTEKREDSTWIGHGGSLTGVSSYMCWSAEKEAGAIVLCNTSGINVQSVAKEMLGDYLKVNIQAPELHAAAWDSRMISQCIGTYCNEESQEIQIADKTVSIESKHYAYQTMEDNYLHVDMGNQYSMIKINVENQQVKHIQLGSRLYYRT